MRLSACLLFTAAALFAQTPAGAPKPAAAKPKPAAAAKPSLMNPAALKATAPPVYKVKFTTTKGDVIVEVDRSWSPHGADRFYNLVRNGFYTNASFFRVIPGFMAQFGINADPKLSALWEKATIADDPVKESNKRGMLSFATAGPNTRTT